MHVPNPWRHLSQRFSSVQFLHLHVVEVGSQPDGRMIHRLTQPGGVGQRDEVIGFEVIDRLDEQFQAPNGRLVPKCRQLIDEQGVLDRVRFNSRGKPFRIVLHQNGRQVDADRAEGGGKIEQFLERVPTTFPRVDIRTAERSLETERNRLDRERQFPQLRQCLPAEPIPEPARKRDAIESATGG